MCFLYSLDLGDDIVVFYDRVIHNNFYQNFSKQIQSTLSDPFSLKNVHFFVFLLLREEYITGSL